VKVVTLTLGAEFSRLFSAEHRALLTPSALFDSTPNPSSLQMPKDEKASAVAAHLLIDDEPDDWCVGVWGQKARSELTRLQGQADLQHGLRGYEQSLCTLRRVV
jgi:hypothetical protein